MHNNLYSGQLSMQDQEYDLQGSAPTDSQSQSCIFCLQQYSDLKKVVQSALYGKHANSQNYFYTREINQILDDENSMTPALLQFNEQQYLDDDGSEYLKRAYALNQFSGKITMLGEYYKYHSDIPRFFGLPVELTVARYINNRRDYEYKQVKNMLRKQGEEPEESQYSDTMRSLMQHSSFVMRSRYSTMLHGLSQTTAYRNAQQRTRVEDGEHSIHAIKQTLGKIVSQKGNAIPKLRLRSWADEDDQVTHFQKVLTKSKIKESLKKKSQNKPRQKPRQSAEFLGSLVKVANSGFNSNFVGSLGQSKPVEIIYRNRQQSSKLNAKQPSASKDAFKKKRNSNNKNEDQTIKIKQSSAFEKPVSSGSTQNILMSRQSSANDTHSLKLLTDNLREKANKMVTEKCYPGEFKKENTHDSRKSLKQKKTQNSDSQNPQRNNRVSSSKDVSRDPIFNTNINIQIKNALICQGKDQHHLLNINNNNSKIHNPKSWQSAQAMHDFNPLLNKRLNALNQISLKPMLNDILKMGVSRNSQQQYPNTARESTSQPSQPNGLFNKTNPHNPFNILSTVDSSNKNLKPTSQKASTSRLGSVFKQLIGINLDPFLRTKQIQRIYGVEQQQAKVGKNRTGGSLTSRSTKDKDKTKNMLTERSKGSTSNLPTVRSTRAVTVSHELTRSGVVKIPSMSSKQLLLQNKYGSTMTISEKKGLKSQEGSVATRSGHFSVGTIDSNKNSSKTKLVKESTQEVSKMTIRNRMRSVE